MMVTRVSNDEIDLYNCVYTDYMKSRRRLGNLDDRIKAYTETLDIQYDKNDSAMSKQKYRLSEVREDAHSLLNKHKTHRGSMLNIPLNLNQPEFTPIERKGRSSLVPFRLSIGSNLSQNGATSEKAARRSDLMKDFG